MRDKVRFRCDRTNRRFLAVFSKQSFLNDLSSYGKRLFRTDARRISGAASNCYLALNRFSDAPK
jgi:hypothetical protein